MAERRQLIEGLKSQPALDPNLEKEFVYGSKPKPEQATPALVPRGEGHSVRPLSSLPLTTRIRSDLAEALKRASLQRQLDGTSPQTIKDILEELLEPWLKSNGYLS